MNIQYDEIIFKNYFKRFEGLAHLVYSWKVFAVPTQHIIYHVQPRRDPKIV